MVVAVRWFVRMLHVGYFSHSHLDQQCQAVLGWGAEGSSNIFWRHGCL
jgi:hypothetical protein